MRLLVVEDNTRLSSLIVSALADAGYAVDAAGRVDEARDCLAVTRYDLVLLDLGLPDEDGAAILGTLQQSKDPPPVLVITARGSVNDRIEGLNLGADDYLVKPFHVDELLARCRAVLRRPGGRLATQLTAGNLVIDTNSRAVTVGSRNLALPPKEMNALTLLVRRAGRVISREALDESLGDLQREVTPNATEAIISRLRRRLEAAGATVQIITARGIGYLLQAKP